MNKNHQVKSKTLKIVVLSGAGLSAESGLSTFRDPSGVWTKYDLNDVATHKGYATAPELVHSFYNDSRKALQTVQPNAAHYALAKLGMGCELSIITQNVDDLHERAGSQNLLHMHGELVSALCDHCGLRWPSPERLSAEDTCSHCGNRTVRPDVVWFGEMPYHLDEIEYHLSHADLFAAIGTSGEVSPANSFVEQARLSGAATVELNLERTAISYVFDRKINGLATEIVPQWVEEILSL